MIRSTTGVSRPAELTDDEAITLRRIAFGESEVRALRRADIERLLELRLIANDRDGMTLTISGRAKFDSLPRALFAGKPDRRD